MVTGCHLLDKLLTAAWTHQGKGKVTSTFNCSDPGPLPLRGGLVKDGPSLFLLDVT